MASSLNRRNLLKAGAAGGLGIVVLGSAEAMAAPRAAERVGGRSAGYGPLVPDPNGILSLPDGFSYRVIAQPGVTTLESGEPTPAEPDGWPPSPRAATRSSW